MVVLRSRWVDSNNEKETWWTQVTDYEGVTRLLSLLLLKNGLE